MEFKEQAMAMFENYISERESYPKGMESGYAYKSTYDEIMQKIEKEVLQLALGKVEII